MEDVVSCEVSCDDEGAPSEELCEACLTPDFAALIRFFEGRLKTAKYRATAEQLAATFGNQCGRCAICRKRLNPYKKSKDVHVDHNHTTNEVRGILCMRCNFALGWFDKYEQAVYDYVALPPCRFVKKAMRNRN